MKQNPQSASSSLPENDAFFEDANTCISCGVIIPEGLLVCPTCEKNAGGPPHKYDQCSSASVSRKCETEKPLQSNGGSK